MNVVVTGAAGLLGTHVCLRLRAFLGKNSYLVALDREAFNDDARLLSSVQNADAVIHCAGINRDTDEAVEFGNEHLARRLVDFLDQAGSRAHVVYANTIQREADVPYGRGKLAAHQVFEKWAEASGSKYTELVLPHVFGEFGRSHYNSAFMTFCHQVAAGEALSINGAGSLELIHAGDVANTVQQVIEQGRSGSLRLSGRRMSVASAAGMLIDMYRSYADGVVPDLRDPFALQAFNTLRSCMYPAFYPRELVLHTDQRGGLFEAVKSMNGGQSFLSSTKPGVTRGNHYHFHKVERFLVVKGEAVIKVRRLLSDHVDAFRVSGDAPAYIDIPTLHTHSITNTGPEELLTMFWSHEIFNPEQPDTYAEPVVLDQEQQR